MSITNLEFHYSYYLVPSSYIKIEYTGVFLPVEKWLARKMYSNKIK